MSSVSGVGGSHGQHVNFFDRSLFITRVRFVVLELEQAYI
jgi:hypothetical protein